MPAPGDDRFLTELRGCTAELTLLTHWIEHTPF